jgi:arsenical pump membrane protein
VNVSFVVAAALLVLVLGCAVARPWGLPEVVFAAPAAAVVVLTGAITLDDAVDEVTQLAPVIGFLGAILVLAQLCDDEGLFHACGVWLSLATRGRPRRLLGGVFVTAAVTTAVLSLDATVVLLTPVVFATATRVGARPKPHVYACTHLSNSASLLLPVSNLTNLLAFAASGVGFTMFAGLMAAPWLVAIAAEYVVFRWFFAADLPRATEAPPADEHRELPLFALVTVVTTLAGFVLTAAVGIEPAWAALAGAVALAVHALVRRRTTVKGIGGALGLPFLVFVLALGVVVRAVVDNGLGTALGNVIPDGAGLFALLATAAVAAVLANMINNLPAVLVLLPLVAQAGPGPVLAVLLGVNLGPNLTYAGSLATLLWRRVVHAHDHEVNLGEFTRLGLVTVPVGLVLAVVALWGGLHVIGG